MSDKNIELVKKLLKENGIEIHPMSEGLLIYAYKGNQSFVCSWLGSNLTVSISINGKANLKKSTDLIKRIFGKKFAITHSSDCPVEGQTANYFGLQFLH